MSQNNATFIQSHIIRRYNVLKKIGSGAYGHVWKVEERATKKIFALKKIFDAFQHATDAQRTYREIQILKQLDHSNIIKLYDTIRADNNKDVYLLFEFMEADLHNVISEGILKEVHIRFIIYQMAKALKYLHSGSIIHRDLKPSNILVNSNCTIKLCDFGLVRSLKLSKESTPVLTEGVATRWYRAPEVLLGSKSYSTPADIWSFGCIVYEILAQKPLFPGNSTLDQVQKICQFTGYPSEQDINSLESQVSRSMIKQIKISTNAKPSNFLKDISPPFADFLQKIMVFNPNKRLNINEILRHEVVKTFHKPQEETLCSKAISTSVDDNKKLGVDQYRRLVYGEPMEKAKSVGSSLTTITSAKYLPTHKTTLVPASTTTPPQGQMKPQTIQKPDIIKKYTSHQKFRTNTAATNYYKAAQPPVDYKKIQRPTLKYVKSVKDLHSDAQNNISNSLQYKKFPENQGNSKIQSEVILKQDALLSMSVRPELAKQQSQSAYVSSRPFDQRSFLQNKPMPQNKESLTPNMVSSANWRNVKPMLTTVTSQKEIRQKIVIKSPKFISFNKNQTSYKPLLMKGQTMSKPI